MREHTTKFHDAGIREWTRAERDEFTEANRAIPVRTPSLANYGQVGDLWMVDLANGRRARLMFLRSDYSPAVWSPDSSRIAFAGGNLGDTLYEKASSGVGDEKAPSTYDGPAATDPIRETKDRTNPLYLFFTCTRAFSPISWIERFRIRVSH